MKAALAVVTSLSLAALAMPAQASESRTEIGYPTGSLGVGALLSGDLVAAETALAHPTRVAVTDPARQINLGQVYAKSGRYSEAAKQFQAAMANEESFDVVLTDGRVMSSRDAARMALSNLNQRFATR